MAVLKDNTSRLMSLRDGISALPADRYEMGLSEGYAKGLAERRYEIWTITLTDGTVVEKEVALL